MSQENSLVITTREFMETAEEIFVSAPSSLKMYGRMLPQAYNFKERHVLKSGLMKKIEALDLMCVECDKLTKIWEIEDGYEILKKITKTKTEAKTWLKKLYKLRHEHNKELTC